MFSKFFLFICMSLLFSPCPAGKISNELIEIIKNLQVMNGINTISYLDDRYIISVANADINGNTPNDKINAMKAAKQISEADISKFVNGEELYTKEEIRSIRVVQSNIHQNIIMNDETTYNEFMSNQSSGAVRNMKNIRWSSEGVYYVATFIKIKK